MTNPNAMAVPPNNSPGLIRLRLPSQANINAVQQTRPPMDSSPQLQAMEQNLRQLIQSLWETAIMVHDLEEGSANILLQKMYVCRRRVWRSDELTVNLQQVQQASGNVTEMIPEDVLA